MKTTKKVFAVLIAFVLTISMAIPAFAEGTNSITVKNTVANEKYTLYKMADLTADAEKKNYSYTVLPAWRDFFENDPDVKDYFKVDTNGRLTAVEGLEDNSEAMIKIAKAAVKYAEKNDAINGSEATATEDKETVKFANLDEGYYVISSTLGTRAIIASTPTNKDELIVEKNGKPGLEKEVEEDSTGDFGEKNDADVGQTVNFKVTITAKPNAKNYVMHDVMEKGLTFKTDSVKIDGLAEGEDYTVVTAPADGCTFEVKFTQSYLDKITADTDIVVTYSAVLNEDALVDTDGVKNDAQLTYGDKQETGWDHTTTTTHKIDLLKYKGTDLPEGKQPEDVDAEMAATLDPLAGAKFQLRKAIADPENEGQTKAGEAIKLVKIDDNNYRLATEEDTVTVTEFETQALGHIYIKGLDSDTYYLTEIEAPAGYNIIIGDIKVVVTEEDTTAKLVTVANFGGTELPSTGGMGTTIFYAVGGTLVVAAAVVLVAKRRMRGAEEA